MTARSNDRRAFGTTFLVGLAGAGLAAFAGSREWASSTGDAAGLKIEAAVTGAESQPLGASLALVALAAWGVVLVVRGQTRRLIAAVGLVASAGALVAVVVGFSAAQHDAVQAAKAQGARGDVFVTSLSSWYFLAGAGAVLATAAFAVAVVSAPQWPAMGRKYDAPADRLAEPLTEDDLWRALDEGHDPTF